MNITLTLGQACMLVIVFFVLILLLYFISLIRNLIPSVKTLAKVMENVEVITESAARSTEKAETVVSDVADVVTDVTDITSSVVHSFRSQASLIGQLSSIAAALRALMDLFSRESSADEASTEACSDKEKIYRDNTEN